MAYQYDVFLSYNRKFPHGRWVTDVFLPFFQPYLEEALNKDVSIFIDVNEINSGDDWEKRIRGALIHSKLMVSIISPSYFRSEWCKKEFAVMDYRQIQCGYLTVAKPNGLIVPIKIFDGDHFPDYAHKLQIIDSNKYNFIGDAYKQIPLYIEFQEKLKEWTQDIANAYNDVPVWTDDWKNPDWITESWVDLDKLNGKEPTKTPPTL